MFLIGDVLRRINLLTAPFVSRILGSSECASKDVVQPAEVEPVIPPAISARSLDLISNCAPFSSMEAEYSALTQREVTHAPVVRFFYGPGILGPDGYVTRRRHLRLSSSFTINAFKSTHRKRGSVVYINNFVTFKYFGHWLRDGIPQAYLAEGEDYYLTNPNAWVHCGEYRKALGVHSSDNSYIYAQELITYSDFSQGSLKRERYAVMKERLANWFAGESKGQKVFLWRGNTGVSRNFCDSERVKNRLAMEGWKIIDLSDPLKDIFSALAGAQVVAGMEGSHLNHAHFATRPGTRIIILTPHDRFSTIHLGVSRAVKNFVGFCVLDGDEATGYHLNFDELSKIVDLTFSMPDKVL